MTFHITCDAAVRTLHVLATLYVLNVLYTLWGGNIPGFVGGGTPCWQSTHSCLLSIFFWGVAVPPLHSTPWFLRHRYMVGTAVRSRGLIMVFPRTKIISCSWHYTDPALNNRQEWSHPGHALVADDVTTGFAVTTIFSVTTCTAVTGFPRHRCYRHVVWSWWFEIRRLATSFTCTTWLLSESPHPGVSFTPRNGFSRN